jgi:excisionase family DNA binding protein
VTLKEAAELLGVTPDNLRGAIARGSLQATKVGRDWNVEPWAVEVYRRGHLRDQTIPYIGMSYPVQFTLLVRGDGSVALSGLVNVSGEGSGMAATGDSVEDVVRQLRDRMGPIAEAWTDVDMPEGVKENAPE